MLFFLQECATRGVDTHMAEGWLLATLKTDIFASDLILFPSGVTNFNLGLSGYLDCMMTLLTNLN